MRNRYWSIILVMIFGGIVGTGCTEFPKEENAKLTASQFFQMRRDGNIEEALNMFRKEAERPGYWRSHLEHIEQQLGVPVAYELKYVVANTRYRSRIFTLDYSVHYPNKRIATETLTLFNDGEDMRLQVIAHEIIAPDFKSLY